MWGRVSLPAKPSLHNWASTPEKDERWLYDCIQPPLTQLNKIIIKAMPLGDKINPIDHLCDLGEQNFPSEVNLPYLKE